MSSNPVSESATGTPRAGTVDMKLEVVTIPVSDVDRATEFYVGLGWRQDVTPPGSGVVQLTPPGSGCSIQFGTNRTSAAPGSAQNLFLIVSDIEAARDELVGRGVEVSEVFHLGPDGPVQRSATPEPTPATARSPRSATPTATAGCCRRSRRGCPAGSTPLRRHSHPRRTWRARCGVRRPHTASTRSAPGEHDENWPDWYAAYMVAEQAGAELPT